jgi:HSP20 family protein
MRVGRGCATMEMKGGITMTTLVKWAPFRDFDVIDRRLRRMLDDFGVTPAPLPAADLYETGKELVVELEVPGFDEKELALEVSDHTLTVKGERLQEKEETDKTFHLHERLEKHFARSFMLPVDADLDKVEASYGSGVLRVRVPKVEAAKPRKIEISA